MYNRNIINNIREAIEVDSVVLVNGSRQVGKSTLAKQFIEGGFEATYITMDDPTVLAAATSAPLSFLESLPYCVVLDEVQRAPELFLPLKKIVDENRRAHRYLLTGSSNVMMLPKLADSLAGRMSIHTLWPLSQGEMCGRQESFIDRCFQKSNQYPQVTEIAWHELVDKIIKGGYPEIQTRESNKSKRLWFDSYLTAILQRDVRDLSNIEGLKELPHLLKLLATRVGNLVNYSDISRMSKISNTTLKRYMTLLESVFLFIELPSWYRNLEKRLVKSSKLYFSDTGLLAHQRGVVSDRLITERNMAGSLVENFVVMEILKQKMWNEVDCDLYHFRTSIGQEVDIVIEGTDGRMVGIEVKSRREVYVGDFAGLKVLQGLVGDNFVRGIVLYTGKDIISFGHNLFAIPISALWEW